MISTRITIKSFYRVMMKVSVGMRQTLEERKVHPKQKEGERLAEKHRGAIYEFSMKEERRKRKKGRDLCVHAELVNKPAP